MTRKSACRSSTVFTLTAYAVGPAGVKSAAACSAPR